MDKNLNSIFENRNPDGTKGIAILACLMMLFSFSEKIFNPEEVQERYSQYGWQLRDQLFNVIKVNYVPQERKNKETLLIVLGTIQNFESDVFYLTTVNSWIKKLQS